MLDIKGLDMDDGDVHCTYKFETTHLGTERPRNTLPQPKNNKASNKVSYRY